MQRRRPGVPQTQPARDEFPVRRVERYVYDPRYGGLANQRRPRQPRVDERLRLGACRPALGQGRPRHLPEGDGHLRPEHLRGAQRHHLPARLRRRERRHRHQAGQRYLRVETLRQRTAVRRLGYAQTQRGSRGQAPHPLHQGRRHGEIHRFGDPDGRQRADGGRRQLFNLDGRQRLHRSAPDGHRHQAGHRDLRREGYRRGWHGEGFRLRFDHRPRRVRRPGRGASPADAELRQIPLGRRLHRPEGGCHDGRQDRGQPEPRQRDGERLGGHQRQHRRHHLDRTQRQRGILPRHRHGGMDGLPELYVPGLHPAGRCERQCRRAAGQPHLPGAEHPRGLRPAADLQGRHLGRSPRPGHGGHLREERRVLDPEGHAGQDRSFDQELRFARHPRLHVGRGHGRHPQSRRESQSGILHLHGRQLVLGLLGTSTTSSSYTKTGQLP